MDAPVTRVDAPVTGLAHDPSDPNFFEDPYDYYRWLRDAEPVHRHAASGAYLISRFQDVWEATNDWQALTSVSRLADHKHLAQMESRLGIPLVVLKCGADGVIVASREGRWRLPGHRVPTVDATGAGDCFDGAFLAELVRGAAPLDAVAYANAAAALTTIGYGAVAPIPRRTAVEAFFQSVGRKAPEPI